MNSRESLARGAPPSRSGTLHARSATGGIRVPPEPGVAIRFGRSRQEVQLCVGEDDVRVSRQQGELTFQDSRWWLGNTGTLGLRLPHGRMLPAGAEPLPVGSGYTPLFVSGSGYREHLVELYVSGYDDRPSLAPPAWPLADDEMLLLVVLGQQYLLYQERPRPLTYRQAAEQLKYHRGRARWSERKIQRKIEGVRRRLSRSGFPYEVTGPSNAGAPGDVALMHNLLKGLVESTTLVPPDLALMDDQSRG
jgi:hypothetical protein